MPREFPKGYRERVFLDKIRVLGAKIQKFCVKRAKWAWGGGHMSGALMVNW